MAKTDASSKGTKTCDTPVLIYRFAWAALLPLAACERRAGSDAEVEQALKDVNVIDESNLNDVMLTVADPNEAVTYFQRTIAANPDRIDLRRGLAKSLVRAQKPTAAASASGQTS